VGQDRISSNTASPASSLTIASPSIRQKRAGSAATVAETLAEIVAGGVEPHALGVAPRQDAEAPMTAANGQKLPLTSPAASDLAASSV
jgi:hypothetical protein